jgi:topoisomerase IA-like protein
MLAVSSLPAEFLSFFFSCLGDKETSRKIEMLDLPYGTYITAYRKRFSLPPGVSGAV